MGGLEDWGGHVRPGRADDLHELVAFNLALAEESESVRLEEARLEAGVRALLVDPSRGRYFIAESAAGDVLGCTMVTYEWSDWRNGQFWWLQSVYVRPEARRRGVFKSLFAHVQGAARESAEVIGLRLYVHHDNESAMATYRGLGMDATAYSVYEQVFVDSGSK